VPTFDQGVAAAVSVSGPVDRMNDHIANHGLVNRLVEVAARISEQMGWGRGVDQLKEPVGLPMSGRTSVEVARRDRGRSARGV
jgi:hypothetical protein